MGEVDPAIELETVHAIDDILLGLFTGKRNLIEEMPDPSKPDIAQIRAMRGILKNTPDIGNSLHEPTKNSHELYQSIEKMFATDEKNIDLILNLLQKCTRPFPVKTDPDPLLVR